MATHEIHDLFYNKTLYMIAGSTEYFILSLDDMYDEPIELSSVVEIEWLMKPASVKQSYAIVNKKFSNNEIIVLTDEQGNYTNQIQIRLDSKDTKGLQGGFIYQIVLVDKLNNRFVPFQGLLVFDIGIESI